MRLLQRCTQLGLLIVTLTLVGCAEGPLWRLGYLNPWALKQWHEEEEFLASYSEVGTRIEQIQSDARRLQGAEADNAVTYLRDVVQNESLMKNRIHAVQATSLISSPLAGDAMVVYLEDPNPEIRSIAAEGLGNLPAEQAVPMLQAVLEKENELDVRVAATRALGKFPRNQQATRALGIALADPAPVMQYRAMESLQKVTGKNLGSNAAKWRDYLAGQDVDEESRFASGIRNIF